MAAVVAVQVALGLMPLATHYAGMANWWGAPDFSWAGLYEALVPSVWLGVPAGFVIGALIVGLGERHARGAEWHPLEKRRLLVAREAGERQAGQLLTDVAQQDRCPSVPLGVVLEGDLYQWQQGRFLVVPPQVRSLGLGVVGASGSGKTVTIERLVMDCASQGRRVVLVDAKGTDPDFPHRMMAAYLSRAADDRTAVIHWPSTALNGWLGEPGLVANRLLAVQDYTEPYWKAVASTAVRLALSAPGDPCRSSHDFLARLAPDALKRAYKGRREAETVAALLRRPDGLDGVRMRYAGFFDALDGRFDGLWSFGDAGLTILTVPTLQARADAEAAVGMLLADFSHWMAARKPRQGDDVTLIVDEFSAVSSTAAAVIDLAERVRDVGGQVIVSAQSYEGLGGDPDERKRMVGALGAGFILHRCIDPDELLRPAGTVRKVEQSWQLQDAASSGMGSMRMAYGMRIEPDTVRQARVGEAWVISSGRVAHARMIHRPISSDQFVGIPTEPSSESHDEVSPWARPANDIESPEAPLPPFLDDL